MVLLELMKPVAQNLCHLGAPIAGVQQGFLSNQYSSGRWLLNSFCSFKFTHLGSRLQYNFHVSSQWSYFCRGSTLPFWASMSGFSRRFLSNHHGSGRWLLNSFCSFNFTHLGSGMQCNFCVTKQWLYFFRGSTWPFWDCWVHFGTVCLVIIMVLGVGC